MKANYYVEFQSIEEANKIIELSFGRILSIGSRPFKDGDIETYENCKSLILKASDYIEIYSK